MATLTWGKPLIEIAPITAGIIGTYVEVPNIKEDSTKLTTAKGAKTDATIEGGDIIDSRYKKSNYALEIEVWAIDDKPIEDSDGNVAGYYAVRVTPEDDTLEGFLITKAAVQVEDIFTSKDGKTWKYTFDALLPATGNKLQAYTKA